MQIAALRFLKRTKYDENVPLPLPTNAMPAPFIDFIMTSLPGFRMMTDYD